MGQHLDLDTPQELPLGHAFVPPFAPGVDQRCEFLLTTGAWCGKTAAEHAPVPAAWWAAMWSWAKGGLT